MNKLECIVPSKDVHTLTKAGWRIVETYTVRSYETVEEQHPLSEPRVIQTAYRREDTVFHVDIKRVVEVDVVMVRLQLDAEPVVADLQQRLVNQNNELNAFQKRIEELEQKADKLTVEQANLNEVLENEREALEHACTAKENLRRRIRVMEDHIARARKFMGEKQWKEATGEA